MSKYKFVVWVVAFGGLLFLGVEFTLGAFYVHFVDPNVILASVVGVVVLWSFLFFFDRRFGESHQRKTLRIVVDDRKDERRVNAAQAMFSEAVKNKLLSSGDVSKLLAGVAPGRADMLASAIKNQAYVDGDVLVIPYDNNATVALSTLPKSEVELIETLDQVAQELGY